MSAHRRYIIITDPGMAPECKGPFPTQDEALAFVAELRACHPTEAVITLCTVGDDGLMDVESGDDSTFWLPDLKPVRRRLESIKRDPRVAAKLAGNDVRIWSREHGAYWRHDGHGYTDNRRIPAWLLPFEEALRKVGHCCPSKGIELELVVPRRRRWWCRAARDAARQTPGPDHG